MSVNELKQKAIDSASKIAMSPPVMKVLANPKLQKTFLTMINANAEVREWIEGQIRSIIRGTSLVTTDDLGSLRKLLRDARAEVDTLRDQVVALEARVVQLEAGAAAPKKAAPKKAAPKKAAPKKAAPKKKP